jgi:hypothetical protein
LPPRSLTLGRIVALVLAAKVVHASAAEARLAVYAPRGATATSASFRVDGVRPGSVRAAHLRIGRSHRVLPLRRVRAGIRHGRVVVRLRRPRRHPRRARLVLRVVALRGAVRKGTPPGSGKQDPAAADPAPAPQPTGSAPVPSGPAPAGEPVPSDPVPSEPPAQEPSPPDPPPSDPPVQDPSPPDPPPSDPPAPDPAPGDCSPVPGRFGAGNWPGACWRPFAPTSPFNSPIPANPRLHRGSDAIVGRMLSLYDGPSKMTAGEADSADDYSHPLYYASADDPVFTLHCYETSWGTCPIEGHRIRIPDAARPAAGGDAHLAVIDHASGWEYDLYKVRSKPAGGGVLEFRWGGRTRLDGDGLDTNATAAHFALSAGIIRPEELAAGRIDHALFMVVKCTAGTVYPAAGGGSRCADPANAPAGGMRFQLDYSRAEIEALPVPRWKKTILHALATYGAYIGDTGGAGFNFQFQSGSTYTSFGEPDRLVDWAGGQAGVAPYRGRYVFDLAPGVDWSRLRVIDPCVTSGAC